MVINTREPSSIEIDLGSLKMAARFNGKALQFSWDNKAEAQSGSFHVRGLEAGYLMQAIRFMGTPGGRWMLDGTEDWHKGKYDFHDRSQLAMGYLSDDELANGAFMNYDVRPRVEDLIAGTAFTGLVWLTATKERIRWLSRRLQDYERPMDERSADELRALVAEATTELQRREMLSD